MPSHWKEVFDGSHMFLVGGVVGKLEYAWQAIPAFARAIGFLTLAVWSASAAYGGITTRLDIMSNEIMHLHEKCSEGQKRLERLEDRYFK